MRKKKLLKYFPYKKQASTKPKGNLLNGRLLQLNMSMEEIYRSYAQSILRTLGKTATAQRYLILGEVNYVARYISQTLIKHGVPEAQIQCDTYKTNANFTQISYLSGPELHTELPDTIVLAFPRFFSFFTTKLFLDSYRAHFKHAKNIFFYSTYKTSHYGFNFTAKCHQAYLLEFSTKSFARNALCEQPSILAMAQIELRKHRKGNFA